MRSPLFCHAGTKKLNRQSSSKLFDSVLPYSWEGLRNKKFAENILHLRHHDRSFFVIFFVQPRIQGSGSAPKALKKVLNLIFQCYIIVVEDFTAHEGDKSNILIFWIIPFCRFLFNWIKTNYFQQWGLKNMRYIRTKYMTWHNTSKEKVT